MQKVIFTAAHSGFSLGEVPLGGGAAVCQHLVEEWTKTRPFAWEVLGPSLLGSGAPRDKDLVRYSEFQYARFCRHFEGRLTEMILRSDPKTTVVLSNDVSEGPDFAHLASKGFPLFTIYHVDVVDYFCRIYLQGLIRPESASRMNRWMRPFHPAPRSPAGNPSILSMLGLVFQKQQDSVQYSTGIIVPSRRMKEVLLRCYPGTSPDKIHVLPWGVWDDPASAQEIAREKDRLQNEFNLPAGSFVLLMLSRIAPEKAQDRLLKALALWETRPDFPKEGLTLLISGEAAYMKGKRCEADLRRLAARLKRCRVHFVGYAAPARKKALFEMADLYVFPSRHESYGLTLLEALHAGLPVLATPSYGAQEVFRPEFGEMIPSSPEARVPELLLKGLQRLHLDRTALKSMGIAASEWAGRQRFSDTASRLAKLLATQV